MGDLVRDARPKQPAAAHPAIADDDESRLALLCHVEDDLGSSALAGHALHAHARRFGTATRRRENLRGRGVGSQAVRDVAGSDEPFAIDLPATSARRQTPRSMAPRLSAIPMAVPRATSAVDESSTPTTIVVSVRFVSFIAEHAMDSRLAHHRPGCANVDPPDSPRGRSMPRHMESAKPLVVRRALRPVGSPGRHRARWRWTLGRRALSVRSTGPGMSVCHISRCTAPERCSSAPCSRSSPPAPAFGDGRPTRWWPALRSGQAARDGGRPAMGDRSRPLPRGGVADQRRGVPHAGLAPVEGVAADRVGPGAGETSRPSPSPTRGTGTSARSSSTLGAARPQDSTAGRRGQDRARRQQRDLPPHRAGREHHGGGRRGDALRLGVAAQPDPDRRGALGAAPAGDDPGADGRLADGRGPARAYGRAGDARPRGPRRARRRGHAQHHRRAQGARPTPTATSSSPGTTTPGTPAPTTTAPRSARCCASSRRTRTSRPPTR